MLSKRPAESLVDGSYSKRPRLSDASDTSAVQAEVAGDFKDSLSDLSANDRYQISTLTIIAKENTEHAFAISEVLLNHIRTVSPARKLPALYVLDSIVKNVGTPYTIFLSRNLFKTFMDAYTLVDNVTRKQMESMLKTWKEAIPGSIDQKPVFPVDTTRNIENALIRARSVFVEQQRNSQQIPLSHQQRPPTQHPLPPIPSVVSTLGTPNWATHSPAPQSQPPHANSQFHSPFPSSAPQPQQSYQQPYQQQYPQQYAPPTTDFQYGLPQAGYQGYQSPAPPYPQSQYQPPLMRSPPPQQAFQPPFHNPLPQGYPTHVQPPAMRSPQPSYQSQFSPPPQPQFQQPQSMYSPPSAPPQAPTPSQYPQGNYSLVALLQASGQFAPPPPPQQDQQQGLQNQPQFPGLEGLYQPNKSSTPQPTFSMLNFPPPNPPLSNINNPVHLSGNPKFETPPIAAAPLPGQRIGAPSSGQIDVKLTAASLKVPRPQLVSLLYPKLPASQCTTCGRRFAVDTDVGKQRKTRHLDAHFRTNMRITENESRGVGASRSWYIDEEEWISYRERDDADAADDSAHTYHERTGSDDSNQGGGYDVSSGAAVGKAKGEKYIVAPSDASMRKQACPICQEEFNAVWHDTEQEWVWMDAVKVPPVGEGARVYHASCLEEMAKDRVRMGAMALKRE